MGEDASVATCLHRLLKVEWRFVADDARMTAGDGTKTVFEMVSRDLLSLDDSLRPTVLQPRKLVESTSITIDVDERRLNSTMHDGLARSSAPMGEKLSHTPAVMAMLAATLRTLVTHLQAGGGSHLDDGSITTLFRLLDHTFPAGKRVMPAAAFYVYLAWCHTHQRYRPRYDEVAASVGEDETRLLPERYAEAWNDRTASKADTFRSNVNRYLREVCTHEGVREYFQTTLLQE
jgi:hypothetical protein